MPRIIECLGYLGDLNDGTPFPTSPLPSGVPLSRDLARRVLEDAETKIIRSQEAIGRKVVAAASGSAKGAVDSHFKTIAILAVLGGGLYYARKKGWI